jgi:hypothetical protein
MNMPGFTAEASHYESNVSYRTFPSQGTSATVAITPQIGFPIMKGCYTCRSSCYIAFRRNPIMLADCLDSCPC